MNLKQIMLLMFFAAATLFSAVKIVDAKDDTSVRKVKMVKHKVTPTQMVGDIRLRMKSNNYEGPFDIVVFPSEKGGAVKYTNIPYILFIGHGIIAFPTGKKLRSGRPETIYSNNFTMRTR